MPNLLDRPLLRITTPAGAAQTLTLPETFHRMMQDGIASFDGLRPHQEHAWHSFLTQLSVIAITGAGGNAVPGSAEEWREAVAALTLDQSDWELIRGDFTKPAFMQPPAPDKEPADKSGRRSLTPDQIDITFANKNFETKQNIIRDAEPDHWIYALITAQTMSAYGGAGHPAASRMNGGYSSRPAIGLAPRAAPAPASAATSKPSSETGTAKPTTAQPCCGLSPGPEPKTNRSTPGNFIRSTSKSAAASAS